MTSSKYGNYYKSNEVYHNSTNIEEYIALESKPSKSTLLKKLGTVVILLVGITSMHALCLKLFDTIGKRPPTIMNFPRPQVISKKVFSGKKCLNLYF